jgi:hypothetical protein
MTGKTAAKKAKAKKTTVGKQGSPATKASRPEFADGLVKLTKLHVSLKSDAKTPDQHADAAIVGLVQKHIENDDHPTAGALLGKLGTWAIERAEHLNLAEHLKVLGAHLLTQAMKRGF